MACGSDGGVPPTRRAAPRTNSEAPEDSEQGGPRLGPRRRHRGGRHRTHPCNCHEQVGTAGGRKDLAPDIPPTAGATEASKAYRLLHAVLARARRDGLIKENPAAIQGASSVATLERRPASIPELRVAANAMTARYRAAVRVAAMTSIRSGELFALRRRDWDPKRHTLRIERSVELKASDDDFGQVKASASLRVVVVPKIAATALEEHLEKFTGKAAAGREDLRWHDLRHTGQSLAAAAGAGIKELQARADHSTTTAAIRYLHRVQDSDRRVATAMDELVAREEQSGEDS